VNMVVMAVILVILVMRGALQSPRKFSKMLDFLNF
jgi:hypothetical protein